MGGGCGHRVGAVGCGLAGAPLTRLGATVRGQWGTWKAARGAVGQRGRGWGWQCVPVAQHRGGGTTPRVPRFATKERDALLLYNGRFNEKHDFVALEIVQEQIQLTFSAGTAAPRHGIHGISPGHRSLALHPLPWHCIPIPGTASHASHPRHQLTLHPHPMRCAPGTVLPPSPHPMRPIPWHCPPPPRVTPPCAPHPDAPCAARR